MTIEERLAKLEIPVRNHDAMFDSLVKSLCRSN